MLCHEGLSLSHRFKRNPYRFVPKVFGTSRRNRESASRAYDFLREAWCSCDAAAAECQLRRVIDTLAGLPSAIDTLTGASFSRTRTAAIYRAVAQAVVGVESGSKSGLGLLQCKRVQHIRRPHGVKQNLTRRKKSALARSSWLKSRSQSMTQQQQPLFQILHGNLQAHIYLQHQMRTPLVHKARHRPHMQQATRSRPCHHGIQCGHLATTHVTRATPSRRRCIGSRGS